MNDAQTALATDADGALLGRVYDLLSANVLTIIALTVVGMLFSICFVGGVRLVLKPIDVRDETAIDRRSLLLKRLGFGAGAGWTFLLVLGYITANSLIAKVAAALGVAFVAGAGTPYLFDCLRWAWRVLVPAVGQWLLDKLKSMFGPKNPPAP